MSSALPRTHGLKNPRKYIVARRAGRTRDDGVDVKTGYLYCHACGAASVSKADFATMAGVSLYHLTRWLNRLPIREDVAARIRDHIYAVDGED